MSLEKEKFEKIPERRKIPSEELDEIKAALGEKYLPSYSLLRERGIVSSPEQFKTFLNDVRLKTILGAIREKNLELALNFSRIKNLEKFAEFLVEKKDVGYLLVMAKEKNFQLALNLCKIENQEQFEELCKKEEISKALVLAKEKNFQWALEFYQIKNREEFEEFCKKKEVRLMLTVPEKNFQWALEFYQIKNREEFEEFCKKKEVRLMLKIPEENFQWALEFYQIKNREEFEGFCKKEEVRDMLEWAKKKNLELALKVCRIENQEEFEKLCRKEEAKIMLELAKEKNFELFLKIGEIKSREQFEKFCEKEDVRDMLGLAKEENFEWAIKFCRIEDRKKFEEFCKKWETRDLLRNLDINELKKIEKGEFENPYFRKKIIPLIEFHPDFQEISKNFSEKLAKAKGEYFLKTFPKEDFLYICASFFYAYSSLKNKKEEALKKIKEKFNEYKGIEKKKIGKILKRIESNSFDLASFLLGRKGTKSLFEKENIDYLSVAKEMEIPFDYYGILGLNLKEIKEEIDKKAEKIIENFSQKKEEYSPHLSSLLAYGEQFKKEVNSLLKIENLWDFKFSHLPDLKEIVDKIKDLKIEIGKEEIKVKPERIETYIETLNEHLKEEGFEKIEDRIKNVKEENRERALELIKKLKEVVNLLNKKQIPKNEDFHFLSTYKGIIKALGLSLTFDTLNQLWKKIKKGERKEILSHSCIEILKKPEEYLGAMDIEPSCMRAKGDYPFGALTVTQAPILVIGIKNQFQKIVGRSLLIPIKERGEWKFELKPTYGIGGELIKKLAKEVENKIGKGSVTEEIIEGEFPKSKKIKEMEELKFWRDGRGLVELVEFETKR